MIIYPQQLPLPQIEGYGLETTSPLMRTDMSSGRARQRRRFTSVPTFASCSWRMDHNQAAFFEAWFARTLVDGAEWFQATLQTPRGIEDLECRFADIYSGPSLLQGALWQFTATLELRHRPLIPSPWEQFPEYWFNLNIIDLALNREWPEA
ncbi:transposase [Metapseudomonas furukawaii]